MHLCFFYLLWTYAPGPHQPNIYTCLQSHPAATRSRHLSYSKHCKCWYQKISNLLNHLHSRNVDSSAKRITAATKRPRADNTWPRLRLPIRHVLD